MEELGKRKTALSLLREIRTDLEKLKDGEGNFKVDCCELESSLSELERAIKEDTRFANLLCKHSLSTGGDQFDVRMNLTIDGVDYGPVVFKFEEDNRGVPYLTLPRYITIDGEDRQFRLLKCSDNPKKVLELLDDMSDIKCAIERYRAILTDISADRAMVHGDQEVFDSITMLKNTAEKRYKEYLDRIDIKV
jgi:hypothetical protein